MIHRNWSELIKPTSLKLTPGHDPLRHLAVVVEPLERGFGRTLGNALRRVLLSSLQGAAITGVHIDGVLHEFSSIPGVREDVTDIVLNLKTVHLRMEVEGPRRLSIDAKGPKVVTAADISESADITIVNKDQVICQLDEGAKLYLELVVNKGKGYAPVARDKSEEAPIGLIPIDALYAPVKKVNFTVEPTREGQVLDYDRLTLTLETNGTIRPEDALAYAARILQDQLAILVNFEEPEAPVHTPDDSQIGPDNPMYVRKVEELELSVRSANCLKNVNIVYIGELVQKHERELLSTPNFGRKSLAEIRDELGKMGLQLGMEIPGWPPENIEELSRKAEDDF